MLGELPQPWEAALIANLGTSKKQRLALAFLAAMLIIHGVLWWQSRNKLRAGYQDFTIFYTAGKILSQGEGARLYDNALQHQTQREFAPKVATRKGLLPYNHTPAEAAVFLPFAKLPYFQAYLLWDALNLGTLAAAMFVLRPHLPAFRSQPLLFWVLLGLAFFPVFGALFQGQDILPLLLLFALAYSAMRRNAAFAAGCWLGLGLFRFPLDLPLVLILARRKPRKLMGGFAVTGALLAVASAAVVGWKQTLLYPAYVWRVERTSVGPIAPANMPNLRGLIETVLSGVGFWPFVGGIIAFLSLALLWFCSRSLGLHLDGARFDLSFSLAIIAAVLVSYHAYVHDLSILLIPVLLAANYCRLHPESRRQGVILAPIFVLFLTPLYVALLFRAQLACLLSILLLVWLLVISQEIRRPANLAHTPLDSAP
jgi:hypothetical protein